MLYQHSDPPKKNRPRYTFDRDDYGNLGLSSFRPIGRGTTPPIGGGAGGTTRGNLFQPTQQGPRVGEGDEASYEDKLGKRTNYPAGGLYGVDERDVSGVGSWVSDRFKVPTGGIAKISLGRPTAKLLPQPLRKSVRYWGAATQSVVLPVLSGSQQRRIFGLDAKESRAFMKTQQVARIVDAVAVTAIGSYALFAPTAVPTVSVPGALPATGKIGAGYVLPAADAARTSALLAGQGFSPVIPTVGAVKESLLLAASKAVGTTALQVAAIKALQPGVIPGGGGVMVDASQASQGRASETGFGGGSGGYSGGETAEAPIEAGLPLPMMIAVVGIVVTLGASLLRKKR